MRAHYSLALIADRPLGGRLLPNGSELSGRYVWSGACGQLVLERDRQQACGSKQRDIEELAAENLRSDPAAAKKWSLWAMFGRPTPV